MASLFDARGGALPPRRGSGDLPVAARRKGPHAFLRFL